MRINLKTLARDQLEEILTAGRNLATNKIDYKQAHEVYVRSREICRILSLRNKIASNARQAPCQDLLEYAGLLTPKA